MGWRRLSLQKLFIHSSFCPARFMHNSVAVGLGVIILTIHSAHTFCYETPCHECSSHADGHILFL